MIRILIIFTIFSLLLESCINYRIQTNFSLTKKTIAENGVEGELTVNCKRKHFVFPFLISLEGSMKGYQLTFVYSSNDTLFNSIKLKNIEIYKEGQLIQKITEVKLIEKRPFGKVEWYPNKFSGKYETEHIIPKSLKEYDSLDIKMIIIFIDKFGIEREYEYKNQMKKEIDKGWLAPV